jgi:signal transduction histidine kinase
MRQRGNEQQLRQLLALQDRERRLLACDIHDGFVQEVLAAQIALDSLLERLLKTDPDAVENLLRIRAAIRLALDESRQLVGELRPPNLEDLHLADSLQQLVEHFANQRGLKVQFTHNVKSLQLDPLLLSAIVRIAQEALNNVARHAKTQEATLDVDVADQKIRIAITDQGKGFSLKRITSNRYGLTGIRERARLFGGKATIRSQPGKGTRVTAEFPLKQARGRKASRERVKR